MFVCYFGVKDKLLDVIVQHFYIMLEFTEVEPLYVDEFPDFCDELSGPF